MQKGKDLSHLEYFESYGLFAMSVNTPEEFLLVDDEGQPKEVPEGMSSMFATLTSRSARDSTHYTYKFSGTSGPGVVEDCRHVQTLATMLTVVFR